MLEQISGCAELMFEHFDIAQDNPGMTIYNVILEKAREAEEIIRAGYRRGIK